MTLTVTPTFMTSASTSPVPTDTPPSDTSVYFDAPLMHFHMNSSPHSEVLNLTDPATNTVGHHRTPSVTTASDNMVGQNLADEPACDGEHLSGDFIYEDGHWVLKPTSSPDSRTASPIMGKFVELADGAVQSGHNGATSTIRNGLTLGRGVSVRSHAKQQQQLGNGGGSTFVNGAGTTGPGTTPDLDRSIHLRVASADASLTPKQKSKIAKEELKEGRQITKVIRKESRIEKEALAVAIKELAELQAVQKAAVKAESKAHTAHTMSLTGLQKSECAFHTARTNYESRQAAMLSLEEALEMSRRNAREATQSLQDKMREVEALRAQKGVDEREREVKIVELTGRKSALKKWL